MKDNQSAPKTDGIRCSVVQGKRGEYAVAIQVRQAPHVATAVLMGDNADGFLQDLQECMSEIQDRLH